MQNHEDNTALAYVSCRALSLSLARARNAVQSKNTHFQRVREPRTASHKAGAIGVQHSRSAAHSAQSALRPRALVAGGHLVLLCDERSESFYKGSCAHCLSQTLNSTPLNSLVSAFCFGAVARTQSACPAAEERKCAGREHVEELLDEISFRGSIRGTLAASLSFSLRRPHARRFTSGKQHHFWYSLQNLVL